MPLAISTVLPTFSFIAEIISSHIATPGPSLDYPIQLPVPELLLLFARHSGTGLCPGQQACIRKPGELEARQAENPGCITPAPGFAGWMLTLFITRYFPSGTPPEKFNPSSGHLNPIPQYLLTVHELVPNCTTSFGEIPCNLLLISGTTTT